MPTYSTSYLVAFVLYHPHFQWLLWSDPEREEHTTFRSCHFRVSATVVLLHLTAIGHSWRRRRRIGKTGNTHGNSSCSKHTQKAIHTIKTELGPLSPWWLPGEANEGFSWETEYFQNFPRLLGGHYFSVSCSPLKQQTGKCWVTFQPHSSWSCQESPPPLLLPCGTKFPETQKSRQSLGCSLPLFRHSHCSTSWQEPQLAQVDIKWNNLI